MILSAGNDGLIYQWDVETGTSKICYNVKKQEALHMSHISPDEKSVIVYR